MSQKYQLSHILKAIKKYNVFNSCEVLKNNLEYFLNDNFELCFKLNLLYLKDSDKQNPVFDSVEVNGEVYMFDEHLQSNTFAYRIQDSLYSNIRELRDDLDDGDRVWYACPYKVVVKDDM